ncbi:MAG: RNA 2',3'-cyclic phosphodiesterase [Thermoguttaceae bacterium]
MTRTFLAVEIDSAIRARAKELIDLLCEAGAEVKWVEPNNLHLTLQFLGEVRDQELAEVCKAVKRGADQVRPFDLEILGAGAFPNAGRPRTLWLGAKSGSDQMAELHEIVALELLELGYQDEDRRFQTHLTIGRTRSNKNLVALGQLLKTHADFFAGQMRVDKVTVFSSRLQRGGPIYQALATARLGEK